MTHDWQELTDLTAGRPITVSAVRVADSDIEIRGEFELPLLARLRYEDQVFVGEFVRSHGSIKRMEKSFGVSYPTIKNRLNRIADELSLVQIDVVEQPTPRAEVLALLESGEITAAEAADRLKG